MIVYVGPNDNVTVVNILSVNKNIILRVTEPEFCNCPLLINYWRCLAPRRIWIALHFARYNTILFCSLSIIAFWLSMLLITLVQFVW